MPASLAPYKAYEHAVTHDGPDKPQTLWLENNLADDLFRAGNLAEAEIGFSDAVTRGRRMLTHGEWDLGMFALHLGEVLAKKGKAGQARAMLQESARILEASLGGTARRTMRAKAALAGLR